MTAPKIEKEKKTIELMIRLYCRKKEKNKELCPSCRELLQYALDRLERCPYGNNKRACKNCKTHCYKPMMREKIRAVMRFSGPRMPIYAPVRFVRYLFNK